MGAYPAALINPDQEGATAADARVPVALTVGDAAGSADGAGAAVTATAVTGSFPAQTPLPDRARRKSATIARGGGVLDGLGSQYEAEAKSAAGESTAIAAGMAAVLWGRKQDSGETEMTRAEAERIRKAAVEAFESGEVCAVPFLFVCWCVLLFVSCVWGGGGALVETM